MSWRSVLLITLLAAAAWCADAAEALWRFETPLGNFDSSPALADMNGDGRQDVIATTVSGSVVVMDSAGREIWSRSLQTPISLPPTVVNLVEDELPEILVLNQAGTVFCLAGQNGDTIWTYGLPSAIEWGTTAIAACDLDGDGRREVVTGDSAGHVVCLSAAGELVWQYNGGHGYTYPPAIGRLSESAPLSIFISGSLLPLICLDAAGQEQWRLDIEAQGAAPIIADINNDGAREILTAIDNSVAAVDANGKVMWRFETPKDSSICAGDADQTASSSSRARSVGVSGGHRARWRQTVDCTAIERARRSPPWRTRRRHRDRGRGLQRRTLCVQRGR